MSNNNSFGKNYLGPNVVRRNIPPPCHVGPVRVFKTGRATIWAGSRFEILTSSIPWSLMVCCAGTDLAPRAPLVGTANLPEGLLGAEEMPWIALDWEDGMPPRFIPHAFWERLAETLENDVVGDVAIYCMGGHGRTGTALSILSSLCGIVSTDQDPVAWVRKKYCQEAVETDEQCMFVEEVTGHFVYESGSICSRFQAFFGLGREVQAQEKKDQGIPITNAAGDVIRYADDLDGYYDDE